MIVSCAASTVEPKLEDLVGDLPQEEPLEPKPLTSMTIEELLDLLAAFDDDLATGAK